jgi:alpha-glucoside transport system substrate-binding protein
LAACAPLPAPVPGAPFKLPTATPVKAPSPLEEALAGKYKGTTVMVGGFYGGSWASDYETTLKSFEEKTGINVSYSEVSQDDPSFIAIVEAGKGPDLVDFSDPRPMRRFAKEGKVVDVTKFVDIETLRTRYDQNWLDWATMDGPDGPIMGGVFRIFSVYSTVWYPKAAFDKAGYQVPTTWQELLALSDQIVKDGGTPWCIENGFWGGGPGWPATWWIDDIVLRIASLADYDKWIRGELKFSTWPAVKKAVQLMSDIWFKPGYAYGGRQALNTTYQWDVGQLMFSTPPKCWLMKEPSWSWEWDGRSDYTAFRSKVYGQDYAFFLLPPIDKAYGTPVLVGSAFITAMFHDRPEVRALIEYLTTGAQSEAWIKLGRRANFSPHKDASLDWYTIPQERAVAEAIEGARKAGNLHFIAGDLMWPTVNSQYHTSISSYVNGDIDLDTALKQIDAAWPAPTP